MEAIAIVEKLNKLDYTLIEHKLSEDGYSRKKISEMKNEGLRFIALCASKKGPFTPSPLVDEFWHQTILCTKLYFKIADICGNYIHHTPNDGSAKARAQDNNYFWDGIQAYEDTFGEPNLKIWGLKRRKK